VQRFEHLTSNAVHRAERMLDTFMGPSRAFTMVWCGAVRSKCKRVGWCERMMDKTLLSCQVCSCVDFMKKTSRLYLVVLRR
jgi:hypothetical protein